MSVTRHPSASPAKVDLQPWIDQILDLYGSSQHLSHGGLLLHCRRRHLRQMRRELGQRPVARLVQWLTKCQLRDAGSGLVVGGSPGRWRAREAT